MGIEEILNSRSKSHGEFCEVAKLHTQLIECFKTYSINSWETDYVEAQMVALDMIFHKLARIGCGNNREIDHWRDIAGYATLVENELEKTWVKDNIEIRQINPNDIKDGFY